MRVQVSPGWDLQPEPVPGARLLAFSLARGLEAASRGRRRGRRQWRGALLGAAAAEAGLCAKGGRSDLPGLRSP